MADPCVAGEELADLRRIQEQLRREVASVRRDNRRLHEQVNALQARLGEDLAGLRSQVTSIVSNLDRQADTLWVMKDGIERLVGRRPMGKPKPSAPRGARRA